MRVRERLSATPGETPYPTALSQWDNFVKSTHKEYLRGISRALFVISPNGNGIDCHRHWESLYLRTIPVVSRSVVTEKFYEMGIPLLILDDWAQLSELELTLETYNNIWGNFNPNELNLNFFL